MNPYALRRKHLKLVRLPISPPPLEGQLTKYTKAEAKAKERETEAVGISATISLANSYRFKHSIQSANACWSSVPVA